MAPAPHEPPLRVDPTVAEALREGRPVVALESTVITHGLPRPTNLAVARTLESIVREAGAVPATVALMGGRVQVGLSAEQLTELAQAESPVKVSRRDFGAALAGGGFGGTTVAGTMIAARAAGIQVFATGGIGGVHRGGAGDVSADLPELARTPVAVVCAGAKSILDLPRTLEWLETAGVPVVGWGTDQFPAFFSRSSGLPVSARVEGAEGAARLLRAHWAMDLGGALLTLPVPAAQAVDPALVSSALEQAEEEAADRGIHGADLTPFLLGRLAEITEGATLQANLALLENNARAAADLAQALL